MCDEIENIKYEYVQSNTLRLEHEDETNETKDGFEVLCDNFLFYRRRKNKDSNYWVCKHKKWNLSMTIGFDGKVRSISKKSHSLQEMREGVNPADVHLPLTEFQILTLHFIKKVKLRCSTEDVGSNKIFEDEQNKLFKSLKTDEEKNNVASLIIIIQWVLGQITTWKGITIN
ncbi:unnamed protein product [Brachionus calyciflorus]|uniref:FLYWCH-type domain-containing protein n=1 Tax=Brachionus calyciflorus TaxID=104777 RepID=A0A814M9F1_9BILA|nr:unnamed protein product [Brachionus calyciflorus]